MTFLGNPQYGCGIPPFVFAKVAEAWGPKDVRIEDPATCRERPEEPPRSTLQSLSSARSIPTNRPSPRLSSRSQAQNIADAFERGEEHRKRTARTSWRGDRVAPSPAVHYA
jgi:pyruvate dehydrogenase (quinone)